MSKILFVSGHRSRQELFRCGVCDTLALHRNPILPIRCTECGSYRMLKIGDVINECKQGTK